MKSRFLLPVILLLLITLTIASCGTGIPKPRANAVGLRYGFALPAGLAFGNIIENNNQVNNVPKVRQPLAFQFGELGVGNLFSVPYFDISRITAFDIPLTLVIRGPSSYEELIHDNPNTFSIKRSQTNTDFFVYNHPHYEDRINKLSEPLLYLLKVTLQNAAASKAS